ncbi:g2957 [Coccomyxa elongata]
MAATRFFRAAIATCLLFAAVRRADADCIGSGLSIRNTCAAFISSVKSQTSNINNLDCSSIRSNINSGQYGTPSSACCNDANAFFGANCLDQRFIYNTAISPAYGFTDDSLRAAATVTAISCGNGGSRSRC